MKRYSIILLLCGILISFNLTAQTGNILPDQENTEFYEFDRLLEQYKEIQALENELPPGWDYSTSDKVHIISVKIISSPNLCGVPIEPGDYIGVFYIDDDGEEACGGAGMWTGTENVPLVAYGDDSYTGEKDGFSGGEQMRWYVYSYSQNEQIFPATPEFDPSYASNNKFYSGGLSIVEDLNYYFENDIVIPAGWSGLSSYTETSVFPPIIGNVMDPLSDELVLLQTMEKLYYPGAGINTMFIWTDGNGYKVKLTEEAVFPMTGCPVTDKNVSLTSTWTIFPVLSECNVLLTEVFTPILDKIIVVKEIAGNKIYWPDLGIQTLYVLEPGKAYYVAVTQNTSVTYGDCQSMKSNLVPEENEVRNLTPWNDPVATGFTHTIAFPASVLQGLEKGDFIGAFNQEGICAGLTQIDDPAENTALTVYGEDISTVESEGIAEGGEMIFKVFKSAEGESVTASVTFDGSYTHADGRFADNGLSVASSLKFSSTSVQEVVGNAIDIFPNPAGNTVNIRVANNRNYELRLQNMSGQLVMDKSMTGSNAIDVSHLSRGVYFMELSNGNTRTITKLILK